MSPWDVPLSLSAIAIAGGALFVFVVSAAICELIERWRKR